MERARKIEPTRVSRKGEAFPREATVLLEHERENVAIQFKKTDSETEARTRNSRNAEWNESVGNNYMGAAKRDSQMALSLVVYPALFLLFGASIMNNPKFIAPIIARNPDFLTTDLPAGMVIIGAVLAIGVVLLLWSALGNAIRGNRALGAAEGARGSRYH